jgi:hypothetical protein
MNQEMAVRVFLKMFRNGDGLGDPITQLMDKTFNKRPAESEQPRVEGLPNPMKNIADSQASGRA